LEAIMALESIQVSAVIPASPGKIFNAWLSSQEHTAFTGGAATIEPRVGGRHTAWDGYIEGVNLALEEGRRILQTWRSSDFPDGSTDSKLEVLLEPAEGGTKVTLVHTDIPEGQGRLYEQGWVDNYITPMQEYFLEGEEEDDDDDMDESPTAGNFPPPEIPQPAGGEDDDDGWGEEPPPPMPAPGMGAPAPYDEGEDEEPREAPAAAPKKKPPAKKKPAKPAKPAAKKKAPKPAAKKKAPKPAAKKKAPKPAAKKKAPAKKKPAKKKGKR
jgi:uncharacterized protein YndB with AHSA1/START domain